MSTGFDFSDIYESFPDGELNPETQSVFQTPLKAEKPGPVVVKRKREGIQLCKVYDPTKPPKWRWVIYETKFDGYRCIARICNGNVETLTSTGLPHWNTRFIAGQLKSAALCHPASCDNIVLDGEIVHESLDFDIAGGILRKHDDDPRAEGFIFKVWDVLPVDEFDTKTCLLPLAMRKTMLKDLVRQISMYRGDGLVGQPKRINVEEVEYREGPISEIETHAREFVIEDSEEGIIAKDADGFYEYRKSGVWLKWKPEFSGKDITEMKDGDFTITGIKAGRGKHQGRLGAIYITGYLMEDGNISPTQDEPNAKTVSGKAGTGFSDAQRIDLQARFDAGTLIGTPVEVKYQELSKDGSLRFPVFFRLREDKA